MSRAVRRGLLCLTAFCVLLPFTLTKPGLPPTLKADESAYYLMALSLAHDHDLRVEQRDVDRLYREFPFKSEENLIVMTDDGWRSVYYGKPFVYPLAAAPFVWAMGANGMVLLNLLLVVGMVWMGTAYLRRHNDDATAALFAVGFFILSVGFAYVFWLQSEVFNMAAVAACLFLGLRSPTIAPRWPWLAPALSGAALALAAYNKPMVAAVGLAPLVGWARERQLRPVLAWLAGAAVGLGLIAGVAIVLTGHATPYLGVQRQGISICEPGKLNLEVGEAPKAAAAASPTGNAWGWLIRVPDLRGGEIAENVGYFLWGRHTGLLLYCPFAALAVLLFLLHNRRSAAAWTLLLALAGVALFFLVFIPWNWQGGGGFVGNRYFVNVYPGFLFLVSRIRPRWSVVAGSAAGGLLLAPLLLTLLGPVGPEPTLQAHTRNFPYPWFPLELSLRNVPGYQRVVLGGLNLLGRRDQLVPQEDQLWLRGSQPVEIHLLSARPIERFSFLVASPAPRNRIRLEMGSARAELGFAEAGEQPVTLAPRAPTRIRTAGGQRLWVYRLVVEAETGRVRAWTRRYPPPSCAYFAWNEKSEESFYLGAALTFLGPGEVLDAPVYDIAWGTVRAPERAVAGAPLTVSVQLTNRSASAWTAEGAAQVRLAYHWRNARGEVAVFDGERTSLPLPVVPGATITVDQRIVAPPTPGRYTLELDPVFEHVAWFGERNGGRVYRVAIDVLPAPGAPPSP